MSPNFFFRSGRAALAVIATFLPSHAAPVWGQSISAGRETTSVVQPGDGALWVWGNNGAGQLGTGLDENSLTPTQLGTEEWREVAAGAEHTIAIREDGSLWSWGQNADGQLGRNDFVSDPLPGRVGNATDWKAVAAGIGHTLALKENGDLYVWGDNVNGQLGNGSSSDRSTPLRLNAGPFAAIAAGHNHSLAVDVDGKLWAWGSNLSGQLGTGGSFGPTEQRTPVQIGTAADWSAVAAGQEHSLGLRENGALYAWGRNLEGQLGIGSWGGPQKSPRRVGSSTTWGKVACGAQHSLALQENGTLWSWGANFSGQLGHGTTDQVLSPRQVNADFDWVAIAAGGSHSVALKSTGVVWSSGLNSHGQLGNDTTEQRSILAPSFFGVPDLAVGLSVPEDVTLGVPMVVNVFVQNQGSGAIPADRSFEVEVRMGNSSDAFGGAELVDSFSISESIAAGESRSYQRTIALPDVIAAGDYFFGAQVDVADTLVETREENNTVWAEEPVAFLADLTVAGLTLDPVAIERGAPWSYSLTVKNEGVADLPAGTPVRLDLQIGTQTIWGQAGNVVLLDGYIDEGGLAAGEARQISFPDLSIPLQTPVGDYYIGARVDAEDGIAEGDEENNVQWSAAPNLTVTGLEIGAGTGQPDLDWTSEGDASWFAQDETQYEGNPALQSPPLFVGEESWVQTYVGGPKVVRFFWKSETQSEDNYLLFTVDGAEKARIFGTNDWEEVVVLAPGEENQLRWTYVKGDLTDGEDRAWVSGLTFEEVTLPDLLVTRIDYEAKSYVLERDRLTVRAYGKNQGSATAIPEDFQMEVRLSQNLQWGDGDDISLGYLNKLQDLDGDNRFIYQSTLDLPNSIPEGGFHLGVFADSTDVIGEFDETNNIGWSEEPDLSVERRPDLQVANLDYEPGIYTIYQSDDELTLSFDLVNSGLADVPAEPLIVQVLLSPDRELNPEADSVLVDFVVSEGLHAGQSRPYTVITEIPEGTQTGFYQYVGINADADGTVPESNEENNTSLTDSRNVFVQDMTLGIALDTEDRKLQWITGDSIDNPTWYGQREIFFSQTAPVGAARPARDLPIGAEADMQTTVTVQGPSPISFFWKVDSAQQYDLDGNLVRHNHLTFSIDGVEMAWISGNVDWRQETFSLPEAGTYTLRWSYVKEIPAEGDADTGWVDRLTYTAPDLVLTGIDYAAGSYEPGDTFNYTVTIANEGGLDVPITPSYFVQVRLAPERETVGNLDWSSVNATDVILDTFELTDQERRALAIGETLSLERSVIVPGGLSTNGTFYLGAWVDYTDRITEGNLSNNLWWPDAPDIQLLAPLDLADALALDVSGSGGWKIGGNGAWSGQTGEVDNSIPGNDSAARSPILSTNEEAWFEAEITGPALMDFSWKVSSRQNFNFLRLYVSGKREKQISGDVDWTQGGPVFIPAGPQTIRFSYEKTSGAGDDLDTAWVDDIVLTPVTQPDLLVTEIDYQPGPYVLERDRLTLTVTAENRGTPFPAGTEWDVTDLEVRLSSNRIAGDDDDVVLGNFARVETFESGGRLVFSGDLHLPLNPILPDGDLFEGNHYLIANVDPFGEFDEYDDENNTWVVSENDIQIRRLPHLVSSNFNFDPEKAYFPYAPLEVDWELRNRGLGDITGSVPYTQEVLLMAVERDEGDFANPIEVSKLSVFSEDAYLPGVSLLHPNGSGLPIYSRVTLPSPSAILAGLGEIDPGLEENDVEVTSNLYKIEEDYIYFLAIVKDAGIDIEQSSDLRITYYAGHTFTIFAPYNEPAQYNNWLALYPDLGDTDPMATPAGDGISNLLKYAFNLDPMVPYPGGATLYEAYGQETYAGDDYLIITFNILKTVYDLQYVVEASDDLAVWEEVITLQPPYVDSHGSGSLTGVGGLIDEDVVVSASDQGYTAAVTIRDHTAVDEASGRFLRVRIVQGP